MASDVFLVALGRFARKRSVHDFGQMFCMISGRFLAFVTNKFGETIWQLLILLEDVFFQRV